MADAAGVERDESQRAGIHTNSSAPYVLRDLISNVPLSADGEDSDAYITCVESWEENLYIGTSAAEILHFVAIPPDPASPEQDSTYILASRTQPEYNAQKSLQQSPPGVEQILLLPLVNKACILCNGTLTFYSLPELSPAFGGKIKQADCTWVGGKDRSLEDDHGNASEGVVIVICLKQRLRLIRIGEQARKIRDIELGGCLNLERRGDLSCVADSRSYSLLDVVNQRKIDLFPISSLPEQRSRSPSPDGNDWAALTRPASRSFSSRSPIRRFDIRGHERISSLPNVAGSDLRRSERLRPKSPSALRRSSYGVAPEVPSREGSPVPSAKLDKAVPPVERPVAEPAKQPVKTVAPLTPHIATPTPNEFLLTTGTSLDEPGVGMFVNLDGDVVRGTIEFSSYPESLMVDGRGPIDPTSQGSSDDVDDEGYVLAIVRRNTGSGMARVLQLQRWDVDPGDMHGNIRWLDLPTSPKTSCVKLRRVLAKNRTSLSAVSDALSLRKIHLQTPSATELEAEERKNTDEDRLTARFAGIQSNVILFAGDRIWWVMRNPLLLQLNARMEESLLSGPGDKLMVRRKDVEQIVNGLRGQDPRDEFEFLTLNFVRQKASLLLLIDLVSKSAEGVVASEHDKRSTEEALISGDIDPRIVLSIIPGLAVEVIEGPNGIWTAGGLRDILDTFKAQPGLVKVNQDRQGVFTHSILQVIKGFLFVWRRKKGFGSIADEQQVFQSVDAALLHLLLMLDKDSPRGPASAGSVRADLNDVVDHGVDCFDRAVTLLEQYKRLYMLSRLYQSRKMVSHVLATWKRILDGSDDAGGELTDGELDVRKYLARIKDAALVRDYGTWLATRNPKLGAQVFADDNSRVQFAPSEAIALLRERAPGAVKDYLEHLVFGKHLSRYANDLIVFYLDTVLSEIETSAAARTLLTDSYATYRALAPPKPTYRQFITDNAIDADWFRNRLRLLQLVGSGSASTAGFDAAALAERLAPFSDVLVPEMIILNGRRGQHVAALRLLVHGLGDYDTAIRYCLLGGALIFQPSSTHSSGSGKAVAAPPSHAEQSALFGHLLAQLLALADVEERLARCAELLDRFGAWFDLAAVLALLPLDWPVQELAGFLVHALRRLVRERNETVVVKALEGALNLRRASEWVGEVEKVGPVIVLDGGGGGDAGEGGDGRAMNGELDGVLGSGVRLDEAVDVA